MSISELMPVSEPVRRIELFTGHGRRRSWSDDEKATILAESYAGGESVCSVARRHGLTPQQLFTWRREARRASEAAVTFAPVMIAPARKMAATEPASRRKERKLERRQARKRRATAAIELEAEGVTVRVADGASAEAIAAVIRALKAST
jgi:transposase